MKIYSGNWESLDDVVRSFGLNKKTENFLRKSEILHAWYDVSGYEGHAWVLYRAPNGTLYEVHGSHCSCHGLGKWEPEETFPSAVLMRPDLPKELRNTLRIMKE